MSGSLTVAALLNQIAEVQRLLGTEGRSVDETDEWGDTALHAAALKGRVAMAKLLLDKGADVNKKNLAGSTPLHKAVVGGHSALIEQLMQHGADGDVRNNAGLLAEDYTKKKNIKFAVLGKAAVEIKVTVPHSMRGLVIGQGGKTRKRISTTSGAEISFPDDVDQQQPGQQNADVDAEFVIIRGRTEAVEKAREMIEEILNKRKESDTARREAKEAKEKEFYSGDYTRITVKVPKHKHRLIIGTDGNTIREIIKETGAKIKIPELNADDEDVVIEGPLEAVDKAAERVTKVTMFQDRENGSGGGGGGGRGRGRQRRDDGDDFDGQRRRDGGGGGGRGRGRGRDREGGDREPFTIMDFIARPSGRRGGGY